MMQSGGGFWWNAWQFQENAMLVLGGVELDLGKHWDVAKGGFD